MSKDEIIEILDKSKDELEQINIKASLVQKLLLELNKGVLADEETRISLIDDKDIIDRLAVLQVLGKEIKAKLK